MRDFHAHSNYSDGRFLFGMARAAENAGLDAIGFADHCSVSTREVVRDRRAEHGFNLDLTYERRRRGIEDVRAAVDVEIYDAVEMDYDPRDEDDIREFLERADFEYALGSVHGVAGANVQVPSIFAGMSEDERDEIVDRYFEKLVALVESELFDVAAHPDLIERTPPLRGRATEEHYRRAARAFADSRTVPEINAGRALTDAGIVNPTAEFLDVLLEFDVPVTIGTDSHAPEEIERRSTFLADFLDERGLDPVAPPALDG